MRYEGGNEHLVRARLHKPFRLPLRHARHAGVSVPGRASALPGAAGAACRHCGAPADSDFCCAGCAAAHALISGLGLDSFYRRSTAGAGTLRPDPEAAVPLAPHATRHGEDGWQLDLMLGGLSCGACVWLVEQALAAEPDVIIARAALTTRRLVLAWRGTQDRAEDLAQLLARLGFRAVPFSSACLRAADDAEMRKLTRALGIAGFGAMNVMLVSVAVWVGADMGAATRAAMHWLAALIGLPTIAIGGLPFYRSAFAALAARRVNMDVAISLAVIATAAMSLSETFRNGPYTWFDAATMLLALLLAGRMLDRAARARAGRALAELLALQNASMRRVLPDGSLAETAVGALQPGERILLAPGERLAVDTVTEGKGGVFDMAAITGESLPQSLPGGVALAAGAVNMGPSVTLRVTRPAADGSLAAMARLLEAAAQGRSRFVGIADRAARLYVPVVLVVAAATFLGWWLAGGANWQAALVPAVAALIITCPCGLALAVPAVQAVAVGALFRRGILVTSPTALERLARATHALLDKTGTLSAGLPVLQPGGWTERELRRAAALAHGSRHPLAQALARACPDAAVPTGVVEHAGLGLELGATRLGSGRFVGTDDDAASLFLAEPGRAPVRFDFADLPHPASADAVQELFALGLGVELASGDREVAVAALAQTLGVSAYTARAMPEDKAELVRRRQARGARVVMVGDGINDAPALALAHVGVAAGRATDLARAVADVVLRGEGITQLPVGIRLARRAQAIAWQNIVFSLAYNVLAVPLAIAGLVIPPVAAAVMASSSLVVTLNALRAGQDA